MGPTDNNIKNLKKQYKVSEDLQNVGRTLYALWKLNIIEEEDSDLEQFHSYKKNMFFEQETKRIVKEMSIRHGCLWLNKDLI